MLIFLSLAAVAVVLMVLRVVVVCTDPCAYLASGWWIVPSAICGAAMIGAVILSVLS